jgi:hypothetical protein
MLDFIPRWCIISAPRSGSTRLEASMFSIIRQQYPRAIRLDEPLHPNVGGTYSLMLSDSMNLVRVNNMKNNRTPKELSENLIHMLRHSNKDQPVTLRIFPNQNDLTYLEYRTFLDTLNTLKFRFVYLERNIFDSVISLAFAIKTDRWHRRDSELKDPEPMYIDVEWFKGLYHTALENYELTTNLLAFMSPAQINYENLMISALSQNVPIRLDPTYYKTYDLPYEKLILNYEELKGI